MRKISKDQKWKEMQNSEGRLMLGYSWEVGMRQSSGDLRGTQRRESHTGQEPHTVPHAWRPGLPVNIPPSLELDPDRILREGSRGTKSHQELCPSDTRVSRGSVLSGETTSSSESRVGSVRGCANHRVTVQGAKFTSDELWGKSYKIQIKSDSWEALRKHRKTWNCFVFSNKLKNK